MFAHLSLTKRPARVARRPDGLSAEDVVAAFRRMFAHESSMAVRAEGELLAPAPALMRRVRPLLHGDSVLIATGVEFRDVRPQRQSSGLNEVQLRVRPDGIFAFGLGYDATTRWPRERLWQREHERVETLLRDVLGGK